MKARKNKVETKRGNTKITATEALASMYSGSWRHAIPAYCEDHDQDFTNDGCPECLAEDHADNVDTDEGGKCWEVI